MTTDDKIILASKKLKGYDIANLEFKDNESAIDSRIASMTEEEKIEFLDVAYDGACSKYKALFEQWLAERDTLPRQKGMRSWVNTNSLKAWLRRHGEVVRPYNDYDVIYTMKLHIYLQSSKMLTDGHYGTWHTSHCNYWIDEACYLALKDLQSLENKYFAEHDEFSILQKQLCDSNFESYGSLDLHCIYNGKYRLSRGEVNGEMDWKGRQFTIDELEYILSKVKEVDDFITKISEEVKEHIKF